MKVRRPAMFECCGKPFYSKADYLLHLHNIHNFEPEKPYKCSDHPGNKKFTYKSEYQVWKHETRCRHFAKYLDTRVVKVAPAKVSKYNCSTEVKLTLLR